MRLLAGRVFAGAALAGALFAAAALLATPALATQQTTDGAAPAIYGPPLPSPPPPSAEQKSDGAAPAADTPRKKPRPGREALRLKVMDAARAAGMPPELADAVATVESNYNISAIGGVGEIGLMQVLPSTARMLGFDGTLAELAVPETNIRYGVSYLSRAWRISGGDICTTVMKYRAGHGESRFSYRSVDYCVRVRAHLAAHGYKVTGEVPKATFGDPAGVRVASKGGVRVAGGRRSRYNWRAADARMKSIASKVSFNTLIIAR